MIQKTAEPAPAIQNRGKDRAPTAAYCCAMLNSRPANSRWGKLISVPH